MEPQWINRPPLEETPKIGCIFEWPEVLAAAMHSVYTDMNRNPQPVRLYSASETDLVIDRNRFSERVKDYYSALPRLTVALIKKIAQRKVGYNGKSLASGDGGNTLLMTPLLLIKGYDVNKCFRIFLQEQRVN